MESITTYAPLLAIGGLVVALIIYIRLKGRPDGNERMREIATLIHDGAMVYLKRQYTILVVFVIVVAILLGIFINYYTAIAYIGGACSSMLAGFFGMKAATKSNVRTTEAARKYKPNPGKALSVAFLGGSVMGLSVASLGLFGVGVLFIFYGKPDTAAIINGFAMGASSIALFARVGGGIYTKTADVGSDLVGKIEAGI
ncbi:MAG: sodium/proton-translocating pyrophosphatase, partial [Thermodesulfobacteriota bacterium]